MDTRETGIPFGKYRLMKRLARGGMAEIFLARQRGPDGFERQVALKRILPHLVETEDFVRMFHDEANLAARLTHPNVVHIYEFGKVDEYYFIAMEFVDGVDGARLSEAATREPLPPEIVARLGADAAAGLHHAHTMPDADGTPLGIVHRDISPQNLILSFDGIVKIVDFGIAKAAIFADRTRPGVVKGKFAYMSPEQVEGKPLDGRSDVFSLGLVLWELLAGQFAVNRDSVNDAMRAIRGGRIQPIAKLRPGLAPALATAVTRALSRDREARPTAAQLGMELEAYLKSSANVTTSLVISEWMRARFPRLPTGAGPSSGHVATGAPGRSGAARIGDAGGGRSAAGTPMATVEATQGTSGTGAARAASASGLGSASVLLETEDLISASALAYSQSSNGVGQRTQAARPRSYTGPKRGLSDSAAGARTPVPAFPSRGTPEELPREDVTSALPNGKTQAELPSGLAAVNLPSGETRGQTMADLPSGRVAAHPPSSRVAVNLPSGELDATLQDGGARASSDDDTTFIGPNTHSQVGQAMRVERDHRRRRRVVLATAVALFVGGAGAAIALWPAGAGPNGAHPGGPAVGGASVGGHAPGGTTPGGTTPGGTTPGGTTPAVTPNVSRIPPITEPAPDAGAVTARVEVVTVPAGAVVKLDGERLEGRTPTVLPAVKPGEHQLEVSLAGYKDAERPFTVLAGEQRTLDIMLAKASAVVSRQVGYLSVQTIPWSDVYAGRRKLGTTPLAGVPLAPGRYELRLKNPDGGSATLTVTIRSGETSKVSIKLRP